MTSSSLEQTPCSIFWRSAILPARSRTNRFSLSWMFRNKWTQPVTPLKSHLKPSQSPKEVLKIWTINPRKNVEIQKRPPRECNEDTGILMKIKGIIGSYKSITTTFSTSTWEGWTKSSKQWRNLSFVGKHSSAGAIIKRWRKSTAVSLIFLKLWDWVTTELGMLMRSLKIWDWTGSRRKNSWLAGLHLSQEFQRNLKKLKARNKLSMKFLKVRQDLQLLSTLSKNFKAKVII